MMRPGESGASGLLVHSWGFRFDLALTANSLWTNRSHGRKQVGEVSNSEV